MERKDVIIYQGTQAMPGILRLPDRNDPAPAIVFTNGYCAYMEMYDEMAEAFCRAGYVTLQYEPRGSRGSEFGHLLCGTGWLEDCSAAISFLWGQPQVDKNRMGLAGVSMGGGTTIRQGSIDPRIKCLFAMAPVGNWRSQLEANARAQGGQEAWDAYLLEQFEDASRVAQGFPTRVQEPNLTPQNLKEKEAHPYKVMALPFTSIWNTMLYVDTIHAAKNLYKPLCIVHGTADDIVPCHWGQQIYDAATTEVKEIHFLEGATHVLPEVACEDCVRIGLEWFGRYL